MRFTKLCIISAACIALTIAVGCASRSQPPDPDALQARIEATHAEFRDLIASEIDDQERARSFSALSDERDLLISRHFELVQRYSIAMKALIADHSSTREEFETLIHDYNRDRRASQVEFVELIGEMKATTTKKEWKKLAKFELQELNPRTMLYSTEVK